jgi:hypothetical protein
MEPWHWWFGLPRRVEVVEVRSAASGLRELRVTRSFAPGNACHYTAPVPLCSRSPEPSTFSEDGFIPLPGVVRSGTDPAQNRRKNNMTTTKISFPLGQILITPNAQATLHPQDIFQALARHARGDWGDCDPEDAELNTCSIKDGSRIFSVYHDRQQMKFWIITEAGRHATTILLPEDY